MGEKTWRNGGSGLCGSARPELVDDKVQCPAQSSVFFSTTPCGCWETKCFYLLTFLSRLCNATHNEINVLKRFGSWFAITCQNMGAYDLKGFFATIQVTELKIIQCKFQANVLRRKGHWRRTCTFPFAIYRPGNAAAWPAVASPVTSEWEKRLSGPSQISATAVFWGAKTLTFKLYLVTWLNLFTQHIKAPDIFIAV